MVNTMRWRYGDTNPVMIPAHSDTVVEIGDLVFLDGTAVRPASAFVREQEQDIVLAFREWFVGVAMQMSGAGEDKAIRIATTGVFEFDCDTQGVLVGDYVCPAADGHRVREQFVATTSDRGRAIGRCAQNKPSGISRMLADIESTVAPSGVLSCGSVGV